MSFQAKLNREKMNFNLQKSIETNKVILLPLDRKDYDELFEVASNPLIWEQHPNKDRWKENHFKNFFDGAIQSKGAFKIINRETGSIIGSTRFYDYDPYNKCVLIGYTFYAKEYWGSGINHNVKLAMLDYAFQFVTSVYFHVGAMNIRSQISLNRLGITKIGEQKVAYFGESPNLNFIYRITKNEWLER